MVDFDKLIAERQDEIREVLGNLQQAQQAVEIGRELLFKLRGRIEEIQAFKTRLEGKKDET